MQLKRKTDEKLIKKYDNKGNLIYTKSPSGFECDYDIRGNIIHTKDIDGSEEWHSYDKNNNLISTEARDPDGSCRRYMRDNDLTYYESSNGFKCTFDDNGNSVYYNGAKYNKHNDVTDIIEEDMY